MITIYIDRVQFMASVFTASTLDLRPYQNGVKIEATPGETRLISTDGHVISAQRLLVSNDVSDLTEFIVPLDIVKSVKANKHSLVVTITVDNGEYFLNDWGSSTSFTPIDGVFHDWQRIIPTEFNDQPCVFDSQYLAAISKQSKLLGNKSGFFNIRYNGEDNPSLVTIAGTINYVGAIMCLRPTALPPAISAPLWAITCLRV